MSTQTKSQSVGSFIASIFVCFMAIGVILGGVYSSQQKAEFNPLPYALGNVYDAEMFQALNTHHASYDMDANTSRA